MMALTLVSQRRGMWICSGSANHSTADRERHQPYQPGKAEAAENCRGPEIFDSADVLVLLTGHVIGQLFDRSVEKFYGENDQQNADHGGVPGGAGRNDEAKRQSHQCDKHFIAQRRFGFKAVGQSTQRILGSTVKTFQKLSVEASGIRTTATLRWAAGEGERMLRAK
jgi:hypothetical protein